MSQSQKRKAKGSNFKEDDSIWRARFFILFSLCLKCSKLSHFDPLYSKLLPGGRKFCKTTQRGAPTNILWPKNLDGRTAPHLVGRTAPHLVGRTAPHLDGRTAPQLVGRTAPHSGQTW